MSAQKHRTARATQRLTNLEYNRALDLAESGVSWHQQPVPDASARQQRAFEARIVYGLIDAFREDVSLTGWPWAIRAVYPTPFGLDVYPLQGTEERVLAHLLPRKDPNAGGLRGVPGLRTARIEPGWWTLFSLAETAHIRVAASWSLDPFGFDTRDDAEMLQISPVRSGQLSRLERRALGWEKRHGRDRSRPGWMHQRNLMLSRLLRRPGLIHTVAQPHGVANIYQHWYLDVVFEWCCGPTIVEFHRQATAAGLTAPIAGLGSPEPGPPPDRDARGGKVRLGEGILQIQRFSGCIYPRGVPRSIAEALARFEPRDHSANQ